MCHYANITKLVKAVSQTLWFCRLSTCIFFAFFPHPLLLSVWMSYQACLHSEGHMDDGLTLQRCQHEESRAARIIRNTMRLFNRFIRYTAHRVIAATGALTSAHSDDCTNDSIELNYHLHLLLRNIPFSLRVVLRTSLVSRALLKSIVNQVGKVKMCWKTVISKSPKPFLTICRV